jgi:transposase-like protein
MNQSIASEARYRQRVVKYSYKQGVTEASRRYRRSRQAIYEWRRKWDGQWKSLLERSRRPHSHPRQHTAEEKRLILRHYAYHKDDRIVLWSKLRSKGYTRQYNSMNRVLRKWVGEEKREAAKKKLKPYQRAAYPGQKLQMDVKFVPSRCVANGRRYYQFTAVDECTRWTYRELYEEHSTYSAKDFLYKLLSAAPFPIREVQTDNGSEFTNALLVVKAKHKTLFEQALLDMDILYHRIRVATPRHNGKVERQHRCDELRLYRKLRMYDLADGRKQLAVYNRKSNDIPKICLGFQSPNQVLERYLYLL